MDLRGAGGAAARRATEPIRLSPRVVLASDHPHVASGDPRRVSSLSGRARCQPRPARVRHRSTSSGKRALPRGVVRSREKHARCSSNVACDIGTALRHTLHALATQLEHGGTWFERGARRFALFRNRALSSRPTFLETKCSVDGLFARAASRRACKCGSTWRERTARLVAPAAQALATDDETPVVARWPPTRSCPRRRASAPSPRIARPGFRTRRCRAPTRDSARHTTETA